MGIQNGRLIIFLNYDILYAGGGGYNRRSGYGKKMWKYYFDFLKLFIYLSVPNIPPLVNANHLNFFTSILFYSSNLLAPKRRFSSTNFPALYICRWPILKLGQ